MLGYSRRILRFAAMTSHGCRDVLNHRQPDHLFNNLLRLIPTNVWKFPGFHEESWCRHMFLPSHRVAVQVSAASIRSSGFAMDEWRSRGDDRPLWWWDLSCYITVASQNFDNRLSILYQNIVYTRRHTKPYIIFLEKFRVGIGDCWNIVYPPPPPPPPPHRILSLNIRLLWTTLDFVEVSTQTQNLAKCSASIAFFNCIIIFNSLHRPHQQSATLCAKFTRNNTNEMDVMDTRVFIRFNF